MPILLNGPFLAERGNGRFWRHIVMVPAAEIRVVVVVAEHPAGPMERCRVSKLGTSDLDQVIASIRRRVVNRIAAPRRIWMMPKCPAIHGVLSSNATGGRAPPPKIRGTTGGGVEIRIEKDELVAGVVVK